MRILRKVPVGQPTVCCMQMVAVTKKGGKPYRTVNFQPILNFAREKSIIHHFHLMLSVAYHKTYIKLYLMPAVATIKYYYTKKTLN